MKKEKKKAELQSLPVHGKKVKILINSCIIKVGRIGLRARIKSNVAKPQEGDAE